MGDLQPVSFLPTINPWGSEADSSVPEQVVFSPDEFVGESFSDALPSLPRSSWVNRLWEDNIKLSLDSLVGADSSPTERAAGGATLLADLAVGINLINPVAWFVVGVGALVSCSSSDQKLLNDITGNVYGSAGEFNGYPALLWTFSEDERCLNSLDDDLISYEGWECYDQEFLGGEPFDESSQYDFILRFNREEMPIEPPGSSQFDEDLADDGYVHDNLCLFPDRSGLYIDYLNNFEYEGFCSTEVAVYLYEGDIP